MINPTAWNWGNYAGFFWAGSCLLCFVYAYFRVPEPSGRTYAEVSSSSHDDVWSKRKKCWYARLQLDLLFERKISARKFSSTHVNAFDVALHHQVGEDKGVSDHLEKV